VQDRPTAIELLIAIRDFLEQEIAPELTGRTRFHMRVVHNLLNTLERELAHEEAAVVAEWGRLASLLDGARDRPSTFEGLRADVRTLNTELSAKIRSGEIDVRWDEALAALRDTVREKLEIANPNYAGGTSEEPSSVT
jgi:hypothetical protein